MAQNESPKPPDDCVETNVTTALSQSQQLRETVCRQAPRESQPRQSLARCRNIYEINPRRTSQTEEIFHSKIPSSSK
jgi:hypothetical protein